MKVKVTIENQSFDVEVGDLQARPVLVVVDGESFEVWPEEVAPAATPVPAAAPHPAPTAAPAAAPTPASNGGSTKSVKAPLPGVIVDVKVKPGDNVAYGQELVVLEAMKMKNAVRATRAGSIAAVFVSIGDHVQHGQPLVEFSD